MKNQRWLFPDGVKDSLYDPDTAKRIRNNLPKFVDEEWLQMFKYYVSSHCKFTNYLSNL
jgi:hypothetical protein